jgi:hypothetical protein
VLETPGASIITFSSFKRCLAFFAIFLTVSLGTEILSLKIQVYMTSISNLASSLTGRIWKKKRPYIAKVSTH